MSGNGLNGIWLYQIVKKTHLGPIYALFHFCCNFFYFGGIIGRPFKDSRLSWRHNDCRGGIIDPRGGCMDSELQATY